jgi:hypothetical protein
MPMVSVASPDAEAASMSPAASAAVQGTAPGAVGARVGMDRSASAALSEILCDMVLRALRIEAEAKGADVMECRRG